MSNEIILYDLQGKGGNSCFSVNVWKARASLNYKKIPYRTIWMEFPDIASTWQSLGIPKNDSDELFEYTCPTVKLPDGTYVMESRKIAAALEKLQPTPSLHLDNEYPARAQAIVDQILRALGAEILYRIPELLEPRGAAWYSEDRKKLTGGLSLVDLAKVPDISGEAAWVNAEEPLNSLKKLLNEHPEGPFVMGQEASFADFIIAGVMTLWPKVDHDGDMSKRFFGYDATFKKHWEACQPWLERHNH